LSAALGRKEPTLVFYAANTWRPSKRWCPPRTTTSLMPYMVRINSIKKSKSFLFSTGSFSFDSAFPADTTSQTFQILQHIPRLQARHRACISMIKSSSP